MPRYACEGIWEQQTADCFRHWGPARVSCRVSVKNRATTIDGTITLLHLINVHTTWHIRLNNDKIAETIRRSLPAHLIRGRNRPHPLTTADASYWPRPAR